MRRENDIAAYSKKESFSGNGNTLQRFERGAIYLVIAVIINAALVLTGWQFNIDFLKQPFPRIVAMNPVTAILFIVCGTSFLLLSDKMPSSQKGLSGKILAYLVLLTGLLRFIPGIAGLNFDIDTLLYHDRLRDAVTNLSNRMTLNTAVGFILSGIALLLLNVETRKKRMPAQIIAVFIAFVALIFIVVHLYRVTGSYSIMVYVPIAINSAICFLLLALAIFFARPGKGLMKEITGPYIGSFIARFLVPAAIIIPVLLGLLRLQGAWSGIFSLESGTAILILAIIVIFLGLAWFIVVSLNKKDLSKQVTDQALQEAEEQVQTIFDAAPDAVIVMDERGMIAKWNPKAEKLLGWRQDEVLGKLLSETIIPDRFREAHTKGMKHFFRTGEGPLLGKIIETCALTKNGDELDIALNIAASSRIKNHILFIGFVRDLTGRKKEEEKFRGLLEAAPDAMIIANEKGEIILINQQTETLFGYARHELIGKPVEILIPADFHNKHIGHRTKYFADPKVRSMGAGLELFALRKDGTQFPVEISLSPLITEEGTLISASVRDISERKKAEEKLRKAKRDFQLLVSSVKDYAIFLLDENGRVASWNRGAEHIKCYTAQEIIGQPMDIFYTEEEKRRGEPQRNLQMALQHGHYETEGLRVRKDGTTFYANIVFTSLVDEEGKLLGYAKVTKDISEKRRAEESFRFLASIADNIQDPVISSDNNSIITRWNEAAEKLFEWKKEEVIGRLTNEILKVNNPNETREQILESLKVNSFWQGEVIYYTKSGGPVNVLTTASYLKDADGNVTGNLILVKDITKRKKGENALGKLNTELEQRVIERTEAVVKSLEEKNIILESIADAFFAVDKTWTVTYWNRIAEIALRVRKQEIIGKNLWEIFSDSIDSESYKKYHEAIATNEVVHFEDYYAALNKWYEISAYPSENGLSVFFKDISERKKAEEEINKLNTELEEKVIKRTEELQAANREMEAFTYSVSHDLRAPLRGIIGFAAILEEDYTCQMDDEAKRITAVIRSNTLKMGNLIDDLLNFSRMGKQEILKTKVNTKAMVNDIVEDMAKHINGNNPVSWKIGPLPAMNADLITIRQVWINLISNAVKYSGHAANPKIEIGSFKQHNDITFYVKDNGVGFDEKYKNKLFKVFQRLHSTEEFEGTGIGLAIVQKIISKHGGKVWAEAEVDKGASFYFSLPAGKR